MREIVYEIRRSVNGVYNEGVFAGKNRNVVILLRCNEGCLGDRLCDFFNKIVLGSLVVNGYEIGVSLFVFNAAFVFYFVRRKHYFCGVLHYGNYYIGKLH